MTITPIIDHEMQFNAAELLGKICKRGVGINTVPWKPAYKFLKEAFLNSDYLAFVKNDERFYLVMNSISRISLFFEPGASVEITNKFKSKVGPNSYGSTAYLQMMCVLLPPNQDYKCWLPLFISEFSNTSEKCRLYAMTRLIMSTMKNFMDDDWSSIITTFFHEAVIRMLSYCFDIPIIHFSQTLEINSPFNNEICDYCIYTVIIYLIISKPTRKEALVKYHDYMEINNYRVFSNESIDHFVGALFHIISKPNSRTKYDITDELIEKIIQPITENRLFFFQFLSLQHSSLPHIFLQQIKYESKLCKSSCQRYYNSAREFIQIIKFEKVALLGWGILSAIPQEVSQDFDFIVDLALESIRNVVLQEQLFRFFASLFSTFPFTGEKNATYVSRYLARVIMFYQMLHNKNLTKLETEYCSMIVYSIKSLLIEGDDYTRKAIYNAIFDNVTNEQLAVGQILFFDIILIYLPYITDEERTTLANKLRPLIDPMTISFKKNNEFKMYTIEYAYLCSDVTPLLDLLKADLTPKQEKLIWDAIATHYFQKDYHYPYDVTLKDPSIPVGDMYNFQSEWKEPVWRIEEAEKVFFPVLDEMMKITQPAEMLKKLRALQGVFHAVHLYYPYVSDGDLSVAQWPLIHSYSNNPRIVKDKVELKEKMHKIIIKILTEFEDNSQLVTKAFNIAVSFFKQMDAISSNSNMDSEFSFLNIFFDPKLKNATRATFAGKVFCYSQSLSHQQFIPATPDLKKLIQLGFKFSLSKDKLVSEAAYSFFEKTVVSYKGFSELLNHEIDNFGKKPLDALMEMVSKYPIARNIWNFDPCVLCPKFLYFLLTNKEIEKDYYERLITKILFASSKLIFPNGSPKMNDPHWIELLEKVESFIKENNQQGFTKNLFYILTQIISFAIRYVYDISDFILQFIIEQCSSMDVNISLAAREVLFPLLSRRTKLVKKRINVEKFPKIDEFPDILSEVTVEDSTFKVNWTPREGLEFLRYQSNGYYAYTDHYNVIRVEKYLDISLIENHICNMIFSQISNISSDISISALDQVTWEHLAISFGPAIIDIIAESDLFKEYQSDYELSISMATTIVGITIGSRYWQPHERPQLFSKLVLPLISFFSNSPQHEEILNLIFTLLNMKLGPEDLAPIIYYMTYINPDTVSGRQLLALFELQIFMQPLSFFPSVEKIFDSLLNSFLMDPTQYSMTSVQNFMSLFVSLIETTFVRPQSPIYSRGPLMQKRKKLLLALDKLFLKLEPNDQLSQTIISSLFQDLIFRKSDLNAEVLPVVFNHIQVVLQSINQSNVESLKKNKRMLHLMSKHYVFSLHPELMMQYFTLVVGELNHLTTPIQMKITHYLINMIQLNSCCIPADQKIEYISILKDLTSEITNPTLKISMIHNCSLIYKWGVDTDEEMDLFEACVRIRGARLFDQVDAKLLEAFEFLARLIEEKRDYETYVERKQLEFFWNVNEFFMMPNVTELLSKYRNLTIPSYIS